LNGRETNNPKKLKNLPSSPASMASFRCREEQIVGGEIWKIRGGERLWLNREERDGRY